MRRRRAAAIAAALCFALSFAGVVPAAAEPRAGIEFVRTVPGLSTQTRMVADHRHHTMIAFENSTDAPTELRLRILDGGTLGTRLDRRLSNRFLDIPPVYASDAAGTTLYLVTYSSSAERIDAARAVLLAIDAATLRVRAEPALSAFPPGWRVMGLTHSSVTRRIYAVAQVSTVAGSDGNHTVAVAEIDPATGAPTWPGTGMITVPQCQKSVRSSAQAGIAFDAARRRVFIGCGAGRFVSATQPGFPAVAVIDAADAAHPVINVYQVAGSYQLGESLADEHAGRYLMVSSSNGSPTQAVYVFDQATAQYLGVVSAGDSVIKAVGINDAIGHLYVATNQGLLVASHTGLKIAQALRFDIGNAQTGIVSVVPFSRLLLVGEGFPTVFKLYRDDLPEFTEPIEDPDASTLDVPEQPGKTDSLYNGEASAYGWRVHEVGGVDSMLQNVVANRANYWRTLHQLSGLPENPSDGDRDLYGARVERARLSRDEASAEAISFDADSATRSDFTALAGEPWPYEGVRCSDLGTGPQTKSGDAAAVTCHREGNAVTAGSTFDDATLPEQVSVGWARSNVKIERLRESGIRVTTDAEARDVQIGEDVRLGRVLAHAETIARGRRGTARAIYTRTFENVTTPAYSCSAECDVPRVLTGLSSALGVLFTVELPEDERAETPGGARGSALRHPAGHQQDVVFNNQSDVERQIPALRLSAVLDNSARSRLVIEFAAVQAVSTYQISLLAPDSVFPQPPAPPRTLPPIPRLRVDALPPQGASVPDATATVREPGRPARWILLAPGRTLLLSSMWALFAVPVLLGRRRRSLLGLLGRTR